MNKAWLTYMICSFKNKKWGTDIESETYKWFLCWTGRHNYGASIWDIINNQNSHESIWQCIDCGKRKEMTNG